MVNAWAYLLVCAEGLTYLGATMNLKRRLHAHNSKNNTGWTKGRQWYLLAAKRFASREEAFAHETLLKNDLRRRNAWKRKSIPRAKIIFARHGIHFDVETWAPRKRQRAQPVPRPHYWHTLNKK